MRKTMLFASFICMLCTPTKAGASFINESNAQTIISPQSILASDGFLKTYIVTVVGDFSQVETMSIEYSLDIDHNFQSSVNGFSTELDRDKHAALSSDPRVSEIYEDLPTNVTTTQELHVDGSQRHTWGLDRINQRDLPLDARYSYENSGDGVSVYVIDSGINPNHQEFSGRVADGFSLINDGYGTNDCNGHGTHVAGIVGAETYGVAKSVNLIPVRVLSCAASGTTANLLAGIEWMINHHDSESPAVANFSLVRSFSQVVNDAIDSVIADNISVVVGAGNNARDACLYSPSSATGAITVGASNQADGKISNSNFGSCVDIFAPGDNIVSAWKDTQTGIKGLSGTSMASPHVAGVVAMMLEEDNSLSPEQVHEMIISTATSKEVYSSGLNSPNLILFNGNPIAEEETEIALIQESTTTTTVQETTTTWASTTSSTATTTTSTTTVPSTTVPVTVPTTTTVQETTTTSSTTTTTSIPETTTTEQSTTSTSTTSSVPQTTTTESTKTTIQPPPPPTFTPPKQFKTEPEKTEVTEQHEYVATTTTTTTLAINSQTIVKEKIAKALKTKKFCKKTKSIRYFSRVKHICKKNRGSLVWVPVKKKKSILFK